MKNKTLCLLVALIVCLSSVACSPQDFELEAPSLSMPLVEDGKMNRWINLVTLVHVQNMMFWCLWGSITALFWNDHGDYYRRCFTNFVSKPIFF